MNNNNNNWNKRPRNNNFNQGGNQAPRKECNKFLQPGNCPTCNTPLNQTTTKDGQKNYLKCPSCGEWGGGDYSQVQQTPFQQSFQQGNLGNQVVQSQSQQRGWNPSTTTQGTTSPSSQETMEEMKTGIVSLGNRMNELYSIVNNLNDGMWAPEGFASTVMEKLEELSSRLDLLQKDVGVSKESATKHQTFLLKRKRGGGEKEKEEEDSS